MAAKLHPRIDVHPQLRSGQPCIKGTRITVREVLELLDDGAWSESEVLDSFPSLKPADIAAARAFAADQPLSAAR